MTRRVLLLDIDGVIAISDDRWWLGGRAGIVDRAAAVIDPELAARVAGIVEATGCEVVVCSSWRIMPVGLTPPQLTEVLARHGIRHDGQTRQPRGDEYGWARRLGPIRSMIASDPAARWVVLDDQVQAADLAGLAAAVTPDDGITPDDAAMVIAAMETP